MKVRKINPSPFVPLPIDGCWRKCLKSDAIKSVATSLEVFFVLVAAHAIGGYFLAPKLTNILPGVPILTVAIVASSTFSPIITIAYALLRFKFLPNFYFSKRTLAFIAIGVLSSISFSLLNIYISGNKIPFAESFLYLPFNYYYLSVFLLTIFVPILEEVLYRGYIFELLKKGFGPWWSLFFVSSLFFLFHGFWGVFNLSTFFVFIYSVLFTFVYINGGIFASVISHISVNSFLFFISTY